MKFSNLLQLYFILVKDFTLLFILSTTHFKSERAENKKSTIQQIEILISTIQRIPTLKRPEAQILASIYLVFENRRKVGFNQIFILKSLNFPFFRIIQKTWNLQNTQKKLFFSLCIIELKTAKITFLGGDLRMNSNEFGK